MSPPQPGIDLHFHSTVSDGVQPPEEVAQRAVRAGLDMVALTDHDSTAGIEAFRQAAPQLQCLTASEITARVKPGPMGTVHVLAYGFELEHDGLQKLLLRNRHSKRRQIEEILRSLASAEGIEISWEEVSQGRGEDAYVGRNHLARILVSRGLVKDRRRAFRRFLQARRVPEVEVASADEALSAIRAAGGISVLAHPTRHDLDEHLRPLRGLGIEGIEVFRPHAVGSLRERTLQAAVRHDLLVTGGSDWHGNYGERALGQWKAPARELEPFLRRLRPPSSAEHY